MANASGYYNSAFHAARQARLPSVLEHTSDIFYCIGILFHNLPRYLAVILGLVQPVSVDLTKHCNLPVTGTPWMRPLACQYLAEYIYAPRFIRELAVAR